MFTRLMIVAMMAGAVWTSPASAAGHNSELLAQSKPAVANDNVPRLVDTKPTINTADASKATSNREATKRDTASSKRQSNQAEAKEKTRPRTKMKAAAKIPSKIKTKAAMGTNAVASRTPAKAPKPERYVRNRERGLDTAAIYAPKTIARLRRNRAIERAETSPEGRASGWRYYVDTYAKGR